VGLITLRGQPMTATTRLLVACLRGVVGKSLATARHGEQLQHGR
jgi:hypothetical protein